MEMVPPVPPVFVLGVYEGGGGMIFDRISGHSATVSASDLSI